MSVDFMENGRRRFIKDISLMGAGGAFMSGIAPVDSEAYNRDGCSCGWFEGMKRLCHIDAHFGGFKDVYHDFDAEKAADMFADAGVQMLSFFAKCWAGYSYYPTELGTVHPGLDRDFTGELTRALKKRGIRTIIYFMLGMERRHQQSHPDWIRNTALDESAPDVQSANMMCFRSPYVDEIGLPQMKEIIERYEPDGFFIDIINQQFMQSVCRCKYCRESYAKDVGGEIPENDNDPKAFAYRKWTNEFLESFIHKLYSYVQRVRPEVTLINNYTWMMRYPVTPPPFVKHITWDTPVPEVGNFAWNFSLEARYLTSLPDITWSCMNTRGNTWGEYSLREPEAFMSECATLLASGGATYLSDIPYPHGNPDPAVMKVFSDVNKRTEELEPWLNGIEQVKEVAVLHSADSVWSKAPMIPTPSWIPGPAYHSVCGAHKALCEGHIQFEIINSETLLSSLDNYRVLILPDQAIISEAEERKIREFVRNGGKILATGETGVRDDNNEVLRKMALADVFGIDSQKPSGTANCYLRMSEEDDKYGIPAMDIQVVGAYARLRVNSAKTLIELVPPYETISVGMPPPALAPEGPGMTINKFGSGTACYCAARLFEAYYRKSTPLLQKLAMWMIDRLLPEAERTIVLANTPGNVEMFYSKRSDGCFVHLVNYSGDKRETGVPQTRDFTTVHGINVKLKIEKKPEAVLAIPCRTAIRFSYTGGHLEFEAHPLKIHDVYMIKT